MKPIMLAAIGGVAAVIAGVAIAASTMNASPENLSTSTEIGAEVQNEPELPSTQMPTDDTIDQSTDDEQNVELKEDAGFFEDDNPIVIDTDESNSEVTPVSAEASGNTIVYETYADQSQNAFNILIPQGWTPSSSVGINALGGLFASFLASSPDGLHSIGFQKPRSPTYQAPSGYFTEEGMVSHEGAVMYYYYRDPDSYVNDILLPELAASISPDVQLTAQMMFPSQQPGFMAGLYEFTYLKDGVDMVTQMIVTTYGTPLPSGEILLWNVDLNAISAPQDQMASFAEVGWNALGSLNVNPDFIKQYIDRPPFDSDAFFSALHDVQQSQDRLDRTFQGFSEATLGVHQEFDANGTPYTVPNSHDQWFVGATTGRLYGSNTGQPDAPENLIPLQ